MFTGIVETTGNVREIETSGKNMIITVSCSLSGELEIDQSVSHDGVCLTVVEAGKDWHKVVAIDETIQKSSLGELRPGDILNLERSMTTDGRFDGHIVQGHVDTIATCSSIQSFEGSWTMGFRLNGDSGLLVEKGSVCLNGVSLTCFNVTKDTFSVAVIPYTYEHTNLGNLNVNDVVNIEFDIIGKYVQKLLALKTED